MELDHLLEFALLAKIGNYQKAADHLFISQSSLSKHINKMEEELGSPLFNRTNRKITLTDFGSAFLKYANEINEIHSRYTNELIAPGDFSGNSITVGFTPSAIIDVMPNIIRYFKKDNPKCSLKINHYEYNPLMEMLRAGELNIAIIPAVVNYVNNDYNCIASGFYDELVAVLPKDHPLALEGKIQLVQLKNETFIQVRSTSYITYLSSEIFKKAGFIPKNDLKVQQSEYVIKLIENGMGVSLMGKRMVQRYASPYVSSVSIEPNEYFGPVLLYPKKRSLLPEEKWIIDYFKRNWSEQKNEK